MESLLVKDKSVFDRFVSGEIIEVTEMLDWMDRGNYPVGSHVEIWYQAYAPHNPSFTAEIVEDLGMIEHIVEGNNIHCFRVRRVD